MAHPFSSESARERLGRAVACVEAQSSAEVVVAVKASADAYERTRWIVGAVFGQVALLYTLFAPRVFDLIWIALAVPVAFGVGVIATLTIPALRIALTRASVRDAAVLRAARATFTELGVANTRDRSGILVFVAVAERNVVVLADSGVLANVDDDRWQPARRAIEGALRVSGATEAGREELAHAIEALAPALAEAMPRRPDDVNELEDVA